jgi:DNA-binding beta-propeller fold protein YncE
MRRNAQGDQWGFSNGGAVLVVLCMAAASVVTRAPAGLAAARATSATPSVLWTRRFNGAANGQDSSHAIAVSPDGSRVFVTGSSFGPKHSDMATVAYSPSGTLLWVRRYTGPGAGDEFANGVAVSPDGSKVFVTGASERLKYNFDYVTVAYAAATGKQLWVERYSGPANGDDETSALAVSPDGSTVFVTGQSDGVHTDHDYATIAYAAATGHPRWVQRYDDPSHGADFARALSVSPHGSVVYVTGSSGAKNGVGDYATVAYAARTGHRLWVRRYNGPGHDDDSASGVAVSPDGHRLYVTGFSVGVSSDLDYATVAYESTGKTVWVRRYNGPGNFWDFARTLTVSPDGTKVFVTGQSYGPFPSDPQPDYATVAYSAGGHRLWLKRYDGPGRGYDDPRGILASPDGRTVYVTGASPGLKNGFDFATVAYGSAVGGLRWVARRDGSGHAFDAAEAMAVTRDGSRLYVTGESYGTSSYDYLTVAYRLT